MGMFTFSEVVILYCMRNSLIVVSGRAWHVNPTVEVGENPSALPFDLNKRSMSAAYIASIDKKNLCLIYLIGESHSRAILLLPPIYSLTASKA